MSRSGEPLTEVNGQHVILHFWKCTASMSFPWVIAGDRQRLLKPDSGDQLITGDY